MIDLHTHILPGIDDGAKDVSVSLAMLRAEAHQGVSTVVATPHVRLHRADSVQKFLERRERSFASLSEALKQTEAEIPEILLGAEIHADHDLLMHPDLDRLTLGDSNALLIELPDECGDVSLYADRIYQLTLNGFRVILAHPERYRRCGALCRETCDISVTFQLSAKALLTPRGRHSLRHLIGAPHPVVVADDCHDLDFRPPMMEEAYRRAQRYGAAFADECFLSEPLRILGRKA